VSRTGIIHNPHTRLKGLPLRANLPSIQAVGNGD
jgi:hypothetical protein